MVVVNQLGVRFLVFACGCGGCLRACIEATCATVRICEGIHVLAQKLQFSTSVRICVETHVCAHPEALCSQSQTMRYALLLICLVPFE